MSVLTVARTERGPTSREALRIFLRLIRPRPLADPYPLYAQLRDLAPFLPVRLPGVPTGFLVSTFAGCSRLLRDPAFGPPTHQLDLLKPGWRDNSFTRYMYRSMVFRAGAAHRERRQIASRHFAPAQTACYRDELDRLAGQLVEELAAHGPGPVDLMEHLALPFAALSLGRLLGIDDDEAIRLGRLARQVGAAFEQFASAGQHATVTRAGEELVARLAVIVAGRPGGTQAGHEQSLLARLAASHAGADEKSSSARPCCCSAPGSTRPPAWSGWARGCCSSTRGRRGWSRTSPGSPPGRWPRSCATSRPSSSSPGPRSNPPSWPASRCPRAAWCSA